MTIADPRQSLENLKLERDAIVLYDALAGVERDPRRRDAFRRIAANERRHADIWARRLESEGHRVPTAGGPRLRVRFIILVARLFGTRAVADLVRALEGDEEDIYSGQDSPEVEAMAADEREHAEIWKRLANGEAPATGSDDPHRVRLAPVGAPDRVPATGTPGGGAATSRAARPAATSAAFAATVPSAHLVGRRTVPGGRRLDQESPRDVARREGWHRAGQSGTLRAIIFGVSDGLVSNLSLVMGVAGAAEADPSFILLAGIAGLLAGSFSMAAGEYISMKSQRELYERQIALERAELEAMPEEEEAELAGVYRSKGFTEEEATTIAHRIFRDPEAALDTLIREELGLDPDELGSPWGAAIGSFLAFAVGALVPVLPYLVADGQAGFLSSLGLSLVALFGVGAGVSLLTGRGVLFSGGRQVLIGAAAALVTNAVGRVVGVSLG